MPDSENNALTVRTVVALEKSASVTAEVTGHVKGLEREIIAFKDLNGRDMGTLKDTVDRQLGDLEDELRTMNSHLDNLVRETVTTNQLLLEDMETRKEAQKHRQVLEQEEREWRRTLEERKLSRKEVLEDDNRSMIKRASEETWGIAKQPLGYLIAGVIFWVVITYFKAPPGAFVSPNPPAPTAETAP